ncbi:hypothetical protein SAMN05660642_04631 [Geodermatophilus siccatus]|uniref:Uncharacterized protein n=1 Tax=Geodermatophilus siccatus TaxID=1137991 RepID=A0A1H0AN20_9ACTN|nr:hypothetical protein [Geodermatophilus siccatus]SDN34958.1 hypothetical protein SAMN05660642_04631 [Geodermatophilus siccatus]
MREFLARLGSYSADYEPGTTPADLAARSDAVAVARLTGIREGRVLGSSRSDPGRTDNLVFVFELERAHRGNVPGTLYVEVPKPGQDPAATFDARTPRGARALLFLELVPAAADEPVVPAEPPLPSGAPLWWFTTPQGFLLELDGEVTAPLEAERPIFPAGDPDPADLLAWLP